MKELVIQLPDNYVDSIYTVANATIRKALVNAKPLPEHHGDLKDAYEIIETIKANEFSKHISGNSIYYGGINEGMENAIIWVRHAPTIIPATKEGD